MIQDTWREIPEYYEGVDIDSFVVMPNHIHGIILLIAGDEIGLTLTPISLAEVVERYKSLTTTRYIQGVKQNGWPPFDRRLWHRNYFERVIRSDQELSRFRQYIEDNPAAWDSDQHGPGRAARQ